MYVCIRLISQWKVLKLHGLKITWMEAVNKEPRDVVTRVILVTAIDGFL